ncbi:hypothetical protein AN958_11006 [Leucoagaricus sp. SymC.cos]|nr:hypothetical protein AN958_11006 [Leucoagaricus sp. SymC.cos]
MVMVDRLRISYRKKNWLCYLEQNSCTESPLLQLTFTPASTDSIAKCTCRPGEVELEEHVANQPTFLVLASDGFTNLCSSEDWTGILECRTRGMMVIWSRHDVGGGKGGSE